MIKETAEYSNDNAYSCLLGVENHPNSVLCFCGYASSLLRTRTSLHQKEAIATSTVAAELWSIPG